MADFTDLDKEQLDQLRKALEQSAQTSPVKQPWQEHFGRNVSAKSQKSILAADIIQGFSGSWAASYNYGYGAGVTPTGGANERRADTAVAPVPIRAKTTKLGRRGPPDVDFVPYAWRTNRFGNKGPSLVGHPISYEVVGPTLKSPFCDWTWVVNLGAGPNGGDELTMSTRPDLGAAVASTLLGGYGNDVPVFSMGGAAEPNGGLYVLISDDGANPGSIPVGSTPMGALPQFIDTARYEIFRVASTRAGIIELHPDKPLSDYFDLTVIGPGTIRAITIVRPYVSRIVAIPGSGAAVGRERTFAVVSPQFSASSDLYPPWDGGSAGDGSWEQGGFDANPGELPSGLLGGSPYLGRQSLPIPMPLDKRLANVHTDAGALPGAPGGTIGNWFVMDASASPITSGPTDVGNILRVYNIDSQNDVPLTIGTKGSCLGWFPIIAFSPPGVLPAGLVVSRNVEVDPTDAHLYFGPGPYRQNAAGPEHDLVYSTHEPVKRLWDNDFFNIDKVESCRLKNLIDPRDVKRFEKQTSTGGAGGSQPGGASFGGPERTIFDTTTSASGGPIPNAANPGSLLDLGFRMVLFPAKDDGGGNPIPDFDVPIDTRGELVIDPSISEQQYVEVDYDGGIVRLSHSPDQLGGNIIPNGIIGGPGTSNPRQEVVLFAACVPFSMEPSQLGVGPRVVGQTTDGLDVDAYSERLTANVNQTDTTGVGAAPFLGLSTIAPFPAEIVLDRTWEGPSTGVIEITDGNPNGLSYGLWGYTETRQVVSSTGPVTALGGVSSLPTTITDPSFGGATSLAVTMRREVFFAEKSGSKDFGIDNSTNDTVFGSSQRSSALRFENARVQIELDGSVTVIPLANPGFMWHQWGYLSSSGLDVGAGQDAISENGVLEGILYQDQGGTNIAAFGTNMSDDDGQYYEMPSGANITEFSGFVTRESQIRPEHGFRLVIKFGSRNDAVNNTRLYVGLVGQAGGTLLADAMTLPAPLGRDYMGIRMDGAPGAATWEFFIQDSVSGTSETFPTGVTYNALTRYLVIETERTGAGPTGASAIRVKMGFYTSEMVKLAERGFDNPLVIPNGRLLEVAMGSYNGDGFGTRFVSLYNATIVNRIDLPSPVI